MSGAVAKTAETGNTIIPAILCEIVPIRNGFSRSPSKSMPATAANES